jgi:hypothetical protein
MIGPGFVVLFCKFGTIWGREVKDSYGKVS